MLLIWVVLPEASIPKLMFHLLQHLWDALSVLYIFCGTTWPGLSLPDHQRCLILTMCWYWHASPMQGYFGYSSNSFWYSPETTPRKALPHLSERKMISSEAQWCFWSQHWQGQGQVGQGWCFHSSKPSPPHRAEELHWWLLQGNVNTCLWLPVAQTHLPGKGKAFEGLWQFGDNCHYHWNYSHNPWLFSPMVLFSRRKSI